MRKYIVTHGIRIAQDFVPETFGRLTTIGPVFRMGKVSWQVCQCSCGNIFAYIGGNLRNGNTQSCGCLKKEINTKHGHAKRLGKGMKRSTAEYSAYRSMVQRCNNPNNTNYKNYGGRGIRVWPEWLGPTGFETWLVHIGPRPSPEHSLDRIDVNGDYAPGNVRWATVTEQNNNTRTNVKLTLGDRTMTLAQWARELGISYKTLFSRHNAGWSVEATLSTGTINLTNKKKVNPE